MDSSRTQSFHGRASSELHHRVLGIGWLYLGYPKFSWIIEKNSPGCGRPFPRDGGRPCDVRCDCTLICSSLMFSVCIPNYKAVGPFELCASGFSTPKYDSLHWASLRASILFESPCVAFVARPFFHFFRLANWRDRHDGSHTI